MKTVIFDMYGVIMKHPEGALLPFVNRTFPDIKHEDVYTHWMDANVGSLSSLEFFKNIGFKGDLNKIEIEYLNTIEIDESFYETAQMLKKYCRLALLSNDLSEWSGYLRGKFKINGFFDVIIVSGDVGIKKPEPEKITIKMDKE